MLSQRISALESLFDILNEKFYNSQLQKVVITVSPNQRSKALALGWFTVGKVWSERVGETKQSYHEINICAEFLDRPIHDIVETMLHEMVHLYCSQNAKKDTSNRGVYHNKVFMEMALAHGLNCQRHGIYGWTRTSLSDSTKQWLATISDKLFDLSLSRKLIAENGLSGNESGSKTPTDSQQKARQSSIKWVCPCCGAIIRSTKVVNVICGDCNEKFVRA